MSGPLRGLGRCLATFAASAASALWLLGALWLELYWHRSQLLGVLSVVPLVPLLAWFTYHEVGKARRWRRDAILRSVLIVGLYLGTLFLLDFQDKHYEAWALWVPAMLVGNIPFAYEALPWLAWLCLGGLVLSYYVFVYRLRHGGFLLTYGWAVGWMFIALRAFYAASFATTDPGAIAAQPGVRVLAPNHDELSCGVFASRCTPRLFPRMLYIDERSRTAFAAFGSTFAALHYDAPKMLAVSLDTGATEWFGATGASNQLRCFALDPQERVLALSQWLADDVLVYDLDLRKEVQRLRYPKAKGEEPQHTGMAILGDAVLHANIWYPTITRYSRRSGKAEQVLDLYDAGIVGNGVQVSHLHGSKRRSKAWALLAQPGANVLELEPQSLRPGRSVDLDVTFQAGSVYDDEQGRLYVSDFSTNLVEVVDVDAMRRVDVLDVGVLSARGLAVDPSRQLLFVPDYLHGRVIFYSLRERRVVRRVEVGPKPAGAAVSGGHLYVNSGLGVIEIALD